MAETDPHPHDEELISAYCDGALRGAELARAEELLAHRPECRQLLEEYRALRTRLQEVPQRTLDGNFAQRVLRRAERDILVPIAPADSYVAAAPAAPRKLRGWPQGRRPWVYAAMALAAALVVMLVESKDAFHQPVGELAQHEAFPGNAEMRAAPAPSDVAALDSRRKTGAARSADVDRVAKSGPPADAAPASAPRPVGLAASPASPGVAAAVAKDGHDAPVLGDTDVKRALDQLGWPAVSLPLALQAATLERQQGGPMLPSDVLIVECNISPQSRAPDPLVTSFLRNSILIDAPSTSVESRLAKGAEPKPEPGDQPIASNRVPADMSSQEPVELFFVIATPQQLDATLADLGKRQGVSVNLLNEIPASQVVFGGAGARGGQLRQPTIDDEKVQRKSGQGAGMRGQAKPVLGSDESQSPPARIASPQGRAQRLEIPDKMRRLIEAAPSAGERDKAVALGKREADQLQRAPLPATAQVEQKLDEKAKSAATTLPAVTSPEQAPLQRALFIVRTRPPGK